MEMKAHFDSTISLSCSFYLSISDFAGCVVTIYRLI